MSIKAEKILLTKNTPEVVLNPEGIIIIRGRSINENVAEFYKQIEIWIDEYICNPADFTYVDIYLEYLNSVSSIILIYLLKKITCVKLKNKEFSFNWHYEEGDEDMHEQGECISSVLNVPFNFIMIYESNDD